MVDLSINVQKLDQDQRSERDRDDVDVGVVEEKDGKQDDNTSL